LGPPQGSGKGNVFPEKDRKIQSKSGKTFPFNAATGLDVSVGQLWRRISWDGGLGDELYA
jgi:hypothetical protein